MSTKAIRNVYKILGGPEKVCEVLGKHISTVYRYASDGLMPPKMMKKLIEYAEEQKLDIQANDFFSPDRLNLIVDKELRTELQS